MKSKRLAALTLTAAMLAALALPVQAAEVSYSDTKGHYAADVIGTWSGYGVLKGYEDGAFRPDGTITRAELAAVLDRVMGYQETAENTFADLPTERWYTECLLKLAKQGIFTGDEGKRMNPEAPITRQETFAAMARALALKESEEPTGFKDDSSIASWAKGYVSAMKQAGYIEGDQQGNIRAGDPITRAEVVAILDKMATGFVNTDGTYSEDCKGNLFVNARDVRLKDMTVDGDLIVTDGVGDGDVYLDKVEVKGDIILRGCGANSFHILPGCSVKNIIVTKTTSGMIRLVNESGKTIPMVYVNDGKAGVTLAGDELGDVVINCDAPVSIQSKKVKTVSVTKNAKVTVEKGTTVSRVEVGKTAKDAALTVIGRVSKLTNDANIKVDKQGGGSVGGGTVVGSSGGSGGGSSKPKPTPTPAPTGTPDPAETPKPAETPDPIEPPETVEIAEVKLQLLAPAFAAIPGEADVLGVGYTAGTEWFNADGSAPSYRWKADSTEKDTFTADQAYKAVITLSPMSDRVFADEVKVSVTDGKDPATEYIPAKVEKSGNDRIVTMVYDKTESKDPVSAVNVVAPASVGLGQTAQLKVSYWNNLLVDPAAFLFQWYRCDDADGGGKVPIAGATATEYTVSGGDTQKEETLYYCCEMTIFGKVYSSGVKGIEVSDALDADAVPIPVIGEEPTVQDSGRWASVEIENLLRHEDVGYTVRVSAEVKTFDGTALGGSGTVETSFDLDSIPEDGKVSYLVDLVDLVNGYITILLERDMAYSYDLTLGGLTVEVTPLIRKAPLAGKEQKKIFDMTEKAKFYIHTYETPDELWQGPSRQLQFVIQGSGSSPRGRFLDKNAPDSEAVPTEKYQYVNVIFGKKNGGWESEYYKGYWDGEVSIWSDWLTGFETGDSKPEVRCAFYTDNAPTGGMNVYYIKITNNDIVFDLENS